MCNNIRWSNLKLGLIVNSFLRPCSPFAPVLANEGGARMRRHTSVPDGPRHATARHRPAWNETFEDQVQRLRSWILPCLGRALEPLFRFAARPTAAQVLEMRSWRTEFPELNAVQRELETAQSSFRTAPVPSPFELSQLDRGTGDRRSARKASGTGFSLLHLRLTGPHRRTPADNEPPVPTKAQGRPHGVSSR